MSTQPCPFCPLMVPDQPALWEQIGGDFFGESAKIGDVPSCGSCAEVGEDDADYWIAQLTSTNGITSGTHTRECPSNG